jgi:hypothetical protein
MFHERLTVLPTWSTTCHRSLTMLVRLGRVLKTELILTRIWWDLEDERSRRIALLCGWRQVRYFSEHRVGLENHYPIERAEKLCKGIRAHGLSDEGLSFLDQFRRLVAEIGNALGFVRMLRLGGMHYCQNATKFVPDLGKVGASNLEKLAVEEGLSEGTVQVRTSIGQGGWAGQGGLVN